jgi:hypothetical protein
MIDKKRGQSKLISLIKEKPDAYLAHRDYGPIGTLPQSLSNRVWDLALTMVVGAILTPRQAHRHRCPEGRRLPSLNKLLVDPETVWTTVTLT